MAQRVKVQEMVMQMHEKNQVLVNLMRDILENETSADTFPIDASDDDVYQILSYKNARRAELVAEIQDFLWREDLAKRVNA